MRIAFLSQTYPPMVSGAALIAQRLAEGMADRGHTVLVLTASDRDVPYRVEQTNATIMRFTSYRNPLRVGQRFVLWPHQEMKTALEEFSPDIIHLHDMLHIALIGLEYGHQVGIPMLLTIHQLPYFVTATIPALYRIKFAVESGLWSYARWLFNQCTAVVTPSETTAQVVLANTGVSPQVVSNGVDLALYHPGPLDPQEDINLRNRLGIPPQVPIILHVGRLDVDKQVDWVVQAAAHSMQDTQAHLLVVGDGTERTALIQMSQKLGIQDRSYFPGFVSIADGLPALFQLSTVFVTASQIENQSLVLLEAVASGLPVVAINATSIPEYVHDGINGWLIPSHDVDSMALHLANLIQDPIQARSMGKASRDIAKNHSIDCTLDAYEAIYQSMINLNTENNLVGVAN